MDDNVNKEKINDQSSTKKRKRQEIIRKCKNHPDKRGIRYCELCDEPFCNECLEEYWSHNFISYAYLGESKKFTKEYLCKQCTRKKRRKGVFMASSLLIILILFIGFSIYNA